jgi:NitT/TauT family transport system substrate-binding protein
MISTARRLAATSRVVVAVTLVALGSSSVQAADKVRMMLDWAFQAQSAPFVTAVEKGYFAAENLEVSIDRGYGSSDAVTKLATGAYDVAFGDVNSMMEFNAKNPDKGQMIAVMMIFDRPALAIFTLDSAIKTPKDLEGKRVLTSPGEANFRLFGLFAGLAGIDRSKVVFDNVQPQLRETLLVKGQGDAATGFYYVSYMNLKAIGTDMQKVKAFLYADYGIKVYGNAILTTTAYADAHPDIVKRFNQALAHAMRDVVASPEGTVPFIKTRDATISDVTEIQRVNILNSQFIVTPYVLANGFGNIDRARMQTAIDQVTEGLELPKKPTVDEVFTDRFLPSLEDRKLH